MQLVLESAAKPGSYIAKSNVMMEGRIELLHYFKGQTICNNYHRSGNPGEKALIENQTLQFFDKKFFLNQLTWKSSIIL